MKIYKCDICRDVINESNKGIIDNHYLVKFRIPSINDARKAYAGIEMTLKSNSVSDMCPKCIKELLNATM